MNIYNRKVKVKASDIEKKEDPKEKNILARYLRKHKKGATYIGGIFVTILFLGGVITVMQQKSAQSYSDKVYFLLDKIEDDSGSKENLDSLRKVLLQKSNQTSYTGTIKLANIYFNRGDYDKAIEGYSRVSTGSKDLNLKNTATLGAAYSYEAKGEYLEAVNVLKGMIGNGKYEREVKLTMARCYEGMGDVKEAIKIYEELAASPGSLNQVLKDNLDKLKKKAL